jgi:hypothetical protein
MAYHTNAGPAYGTLRLGAGSGALDVTKGLTSIILFGTATEIVSGQGGIALWQPTVHGVELPGLYVVLDHELWSAR